jgi:two-component system NtrC family sensor kinase
MASAATGSLDRHRPEKVMSGSAPPELGTALLAAALDGIVVMDADGLIRELNPAAERAFGYSRDETLGRPLAELILPPEQRMAGRAGLQRLVEAGPGRMTGQRIKLEGMRKDGSLFPLELAITELPPHDGMYLAYLRDITDRKAAEAALLESEAKLKAFMDHAPISVHIRDREGRYVVANPQTARLFKRPLHEIIGRHPHEILPPDMAEQAEMRLAEARLKGEVIVDEDRQVDLDPCFWLRTIRVPLKDAAGELVGLGTFDIDITERKRAEAELQRQREVLHQSEKLAALGSLLAGVAHELNNPLSVVLGRSIMLEEDVTDPVIREQLGALRAAAERCARIVRTFLSMARQKPQARRRIAVEASIEAALELLAYGLQTAGIEVMRDWQAGSAGSVDADEDALHQVFLNLIVNAQQALSDRPGPRRLGLSTRIDGAWLELAVADNGPGIERAIRGRVFDPFFTTKPEGSGTGIGLAVCHGIVTAHGGSIELGEPEGGGARFVLRLPLAPAEPPAKQSPAAGEPASPLAAHVLVVDDEPDIVTLLADIVAREGCTVTRAGSGEAALCALAGERFDLVITDLRMAGQDGRALLDRLAGQDGRRPAVIVLTGDILALPKLGRMQDPQTILLEKPVEPAVLRDAVRRLLALCPRPPESRPRGYG